MRCYANTPLLIYAMFYGYNVGDSNGMDELKSASRGRGNTDDT